MDIPREILLEAQGGSLEAFEKVYKASSSFVYSVAFRVTNSREDAEEVTQDVFLKIHKYLKGFRFKSSFKTWVYRITMNTALNICRRMIKEQSKRVDYEDVIATIAVKDDSINSVDVEHRQAKVQQLLSKLNFQQRSCIILREMEGLSYADIAKALRININTVRSRLKRAREALMGIAKLQGGTI